MTCDTRGKGSFLRWAEPRRSGEELGLEKLESRLIKEGTYSEAVGGGGWG